MQGRDEHSCGNCKNGRKSGGNMIYCRLYGIFIRKDYDGCRYEVREQKDGDRGPAV